MKNKYPDIIIAYPDIVLEQLIDNALSYVSLSQAKAYVKSVQKFNNHKTYINYVAPRPGEYIVEGEYGKATYWFNLKEDLRLFPVYFAGMEKAGLSTDQAFDLLIKLQKSHKGGYIQTANGISALINTAEHCVEKNIDLASGHRMLTSLFSLCGQDEEIGRGLGIFNLSLTAGFTIEQALDTVKNIYKYGWSSGHVMMAMYDEFASLKTHNFDPTQLYEVIQLTTKTGGSYSDLVCALYGLHAKQPSAGKRFLQGILEYGKLADNLELSHNKGFLEAAIIPFVAENNLNTEVMANGSSEVYFPEIDVKHVIHGIMPYRVKRSLMNGISDLKNAGKKGITEGQFIFSPENEIWYSLGGRTSVGTGRVRHEVYKYDISKLSVAPIFIHSHPERAEIFVTPNSDNLSHSCLKEKLTKFFSAIPSGADFMFMAECAEGSSTSFPLQGMIATSSGVTIYKAPKDIQKVKEFAKNFQSLKDEVLSNFDVDNYLATGLDAESNEQFARTIVYYVDRILPEGFSIKTVPYEEATLVLRQSLSRQMSFTNEVIYS